MKTLFLIFFVSILSSTAFAVPCPVQKGEFYGVVATFDFNSKKAEIASMIPVQRAEVCIPADEDTAQLKLLDEAGVELFSKNVRIRCADGDCNRGGLVYDSIPQFPQAKRLNLIFLGQVADFYVRGSTPPDVQKLDFTCDAAGGNAPYHLTWESSGSGKIRYLIEISKNKSDWNSIAVNYPKPSIRLTDSALNTYGIGHRDPVWFYVESSDGFSTSNPIIAGPYTLEEVCKN